MGRLGPDTYWMCRASARYGLCSLIRLSRACTWFSVAQPTPWTPLPISPMPWFVSLKSNGVNMHDFVWFDFDSMVESIRIGVSPMGSLTLGLGRRMGCSDDGLRLIVWGTVWASHKVGADCRVRHIQVYFVPVWGAYSQNTRSEEKRFLLSSD